MTPAVEAQEALASPGALTPTAEEDLVAEKVGAFVTF